MESMDDPSSRGGMTRRSQREALQPTPGREPSPGRESPAPAMPTRRSRREDVGDEGSGPTAAPAAPAAACRPRSVSGSLLGGLAIASLLTRKETFVALVSLAIVLAVWELCSALAVRGISVPVFPLAVGSVGMLVSAFVAGGDGLLVAYTLTAFGLLLWRIIEGLNGAVRDVTAGVFAAAYLPFLAGFSILMLNQPDGAQRVLTFLSVAVASDVGGYVAGVLVGKHPLARSVSPKKTWEGLAGSVLACVLVAVPMVQRLLHGTPAAGVVLGIAIAITATIGDLAESMLKRDLGIKDMSSLLPGHGGVLDRIDGMLLSAPVAYLLLTALVPVG